MTGRVMATARGPASKAPAVNAGRRIVRGQFAAGVDDVGAACAGGSRLVAHLLEVHALSDIEGERGQIGIEPGGQRRHGRGAFETAAVGDDETFGHDRISPFNRTSRSRATVPSRAITRIVSSPAIVPTTSPNCARSNATAAACA